MSGGYWIIPKYGSTLASFVDGDNHDDPYSQPTTSYAKSERFFIAKPLKSLQRDKAPHDHSSSQEFTGKKLFVLDNGLDSELGYPKDLQTLYDSDSVDNLENNRRPDHGDEGDLLAIE